MPDLNNYCVPWGRPMFEGSLVLCKVILKSNHGLVKKLICKTTGTHNIGGRDMGPCFKYDFFLGFTLLLGDGFIYISGIPSD